MTERQTIQGDTRGIGGHTLPNKGATDSWITPKHIIDALGPFDLDPCQCMPQPWPCAAFAYERNGLDEPWFGRVWLNPPYSNAAAWLDKLAEHGRGTALIFARTETAMFQEHVWKEATGILFLWGRLFFHKPDGERAKGNSGGPSVLIAYGDDDAERLRSCGLPGSYVSGWSSGGSYKDNGLLQADLREIEKQHSHAIAMRAESHHPDVRFHWLRKIIALQERRIRLIANAVMADGKPACAMCGDGGMTILNDGSPAACPHCTD